MTTTWNANNTGPNCVITNSELTIQCNDYGNDQGMVATGSFAQSLSLFWSMLVNETGAGYEPILGVCISAFAVISNTIGSDNNSVGYSSNGDVSKNNTPLDTLPTYAANDVIDVAVANGNIWYRKNGGNWNNNSSANPSTNTGGIAHGLSGSLYPGASGRAGSQITANFGASAFTYAVPSGFSSFDGSGGGGGGSGNTSNTSVTVGTTAPSSPVVGQLWFNTNTGVNVLFIWIGGPNWIPVNQSPNFAVAT
jgi:hypothetical protein